MAESQRRAPGQNRMTGFRVRLVAGLIVLGMLLTVVATPAASSGHDRGLSAGAHHRDGSGAANTDKTFERLPVRFEANEGQTDPEVEYLARGTGYTLFLTRTEAVLSLARPGTGAGHDGPDAQTGVDVVRLSLAGGNQEPELVGLDRLAGHSNYYGGSDPSRWHEGVATYGRVAYRGAYPGIDLIFHGDGGQVKFDFVVAPGADPGAITMDVEGAALALDGGDLVMTTPSGAQLRKPAPLVYQDIGNARQTVAGSYVLEGDRHFGFRLGSHDPAYPLVIDPALTYSFTLQGETPYRIAVDRFGSAYVHGETSSADFPGRPPAQPPGATPDVFVAKLTPDGAGIVYTTFLGKRGGSDTESLRLRIHGLDVDGDGRAYVAGEDLDDTLSDVDTIPVVGGGTPRVPGPAPCARRCSFDDYLRYDGFLVRLEPGGRVDYGTYLQDHMRVRDVAVDTHGVYLVGQTRNPALGTTAGAVEKTPVGNFGSGPDMGWGFVARVVPGPNPAAFYQYLTYFGTRLHIHAVAADGSGRAHVTGTLTWYDGGGNGAPVNAFEDDDGRVPITANAFQPQRRQRQQDLFVSKMNTLTAAPGASLEYSTYLGGSDTGCPGPGVTGLACQGAMDIAVHGGMMYMTGFSASTLDFPTTPTAVQPINLGSLTAFVAKLDPAQSGIFSLVYSTFLGGSDQERGLGVAVAPEGLVTVTGWTNSSSFPVLDPLTGQEGHGGGGPDGFVTSLDMTKVGSAGLLRSTFLGGGGADQGGSVAVDPAGDLYLRGSTASGDFPTTAGAFGSGGSGGFVAKIDVPCPSVPGTTVPLAAPSAPRTASSPSGVAGSGALDAALGPSGGATAAVRRGRRRRRRRGRATTAPGGRAERPRRRLRGEGGFSLIELLVVILILGILSAVVILSVRGSGDKGKQAAIQTDERVIRTALEVYCAQKGAYPFDSSKDPMQVLVDERFLGSRSSYHGIETGDLLPEGSCPGTPSHYRLTGPAAGKPPILPCP